MESGHATSSPAPPRSKDSIGVVHRLDPPTRSNVRPERLDARRGCATRSSQEDSRAGRPPTPAAPRAARCRAPVLRKRRVEQRLGGFADFHQGCRGTRSAARDSRGGGQAREAPWLRLCAAGGMVVRQLREQRRAQRQRSRASRSQETASPHQRRVTFVVRIMSAPSRHRGPWRRAPPIETLNCSGRRNRAIPPVGEGSWMRSVHRSVTTADLEVLPGDTPPVRVS
jgi:hypothetical protein